MDGAVSVTDSVDAVVGVRQDWGQGNESGSLWPVEHLGLEPGELVLQVGEVLGQGLDDAGVDGADDAVIGGPQVL